MLCGDECSLRGDAGLYRSVAAIRCFVGTQKKTGFSVGPTIAFEAYADNAVVLTKNTQHGRIEKYTKARSM